MIRALSLPPILQDIPLVTFNCEFVNYNFIYTNVPLKIQKCEYIIDINVPTWSLAIDAKLAINIMNHQKSSIYF